MAEQIEVRVGCEFVYTCSYPATLIAGVEPKTEFDRRVVENSWSITPDVPVARDRDIYGNDIVRTTMPVGETVLRYDALVSLSGDIDAADFSAPHTPPQDVPGDVLAYLLPSRFCLSDLLLNDAWSLFGNTELGWPRVQAVCDWVYTNIGFQYGTSFPMTSSWDTYTNRIGVCRDFAHLAITFCRALTIPARYAFGYLPDIDVPPPTSPMDFCAWMEVYLGDRWWTFDPRNNMRRVGHIVIARGRDAADVPMITTYGSAMFSGMTVWADKVS